jgi:hypothetical protein
MIPEDKNSNLLIDLEQAIRTRNPLLADRFQDGLSEQYVRRTFERAGVCGETRALVELYAWKNGTIIDLELTSSESGFFPGKHFQFVELRRAILDFRFFKEMAESHPENSKLIELVGRYFPFLWDGAVGHLAVDLDVSYGNRVMIVDTDKACPLRVAYGSFKAFLVDVIRANLENAPLACF